MSLREPETASGPGASMEIRIQKIQEAVREEGVAAWLFFDFHGTNPVARRILGVAEGAGAPKTSRRWFYLVPALGTPVKLTHRLEPNALAHLPGEGIIYLRWQELDRALRSIVDRVAEAGLAAAGGAAAGGAMASIAMEYSPRARLPYVSRVDAGTVELVRASGATVVSSANLAQRFDGVLSPEARLDHQRTGKILNGIIHGAFERARDAARGSSSGPVLTESALQRWILDRFAAEGLVTSDSPTIALDAHSGDPHFSNSPATDATIRPGCFLLVDAWAKSSRPGSVYADYTQVAFLGSTAPDRIRDAFHVVRDARDAAIAAVRKALEAKKAIRGCDVDDAARAVIASHGHADHFVHRTGHSIGEEVHANGVHLDNLETHDERLLLDGTLVSVEPGIYFEEFGVRTEVNLLLDAGKALVTTEPVQDELPALLA